jgi:glucose-6-phosphate-specific signal transduction histidine kinase
LVRQLNRAQRALEKETAERRRLERSIVGLRENDRRWLAQLLHTTLCQSISGLTLLSRVVSRRARNASSSPDGADSIVQLDQAVGHAAAEVHRLSERLKPLSSDGKTLDETLREIVQLAAERVPCKLSCARELHAADDFVAAQLAWIAHEAVLDVLHRPGVERINVQLSVQRGDTVLEVRAKCRGAAKPRTEEALFFREMLQAHAAAIGAELTISQGRGRDAVITCKAPRSSGNGRCPATRPSRKAGGSPANP